jgi:hypothetical protein
MDTSKVPPPRVEDHDLAVDLLAEPVGQRGRGGLVDDADDVETGDAAGVLGGLALAVVEIGRHRDHGLGQRLTQIFLGDGAHFLQHVGRDLGHREDLVAQADAHVAVRSFHEWIGHCRFDRLDGGRSPGPADEAFDRPGRVLGVGHSLAFGDVSDQPLAAFGHGHHRRCRLVAATVGDDRGGRALEHGHARVGGS